MAVSKYLSETLWIGSRAYLVEVKNFKDSKQKYMIITQPEVPEGDQHPVIIPEYHMGSFLEAMQRVDESMLPTARPIKPVASVKREHHPRKDAASEPQRSKSNPPEFCNSGKRWSAADDQLLVEQHRSGATIEALTKTFKRRVKSIEVRLYKLGELP